MTKQSLRATPEGIQKAKQVIKKDGWTQEEIGKEIGKTRQPVGKFLDGQRIERLNFIDICNLLGLNWKEIAEPEPVEQKQNTSVDIDALVQELREKVKPCIQACCGTMRVLDMSQPIGLNDIYTKVNILEKITGRQYKNAEWQKECNSDNFERFGLGSTTEERVPGLTAVENYSKLMILGKPGAGKTTFLKYVAIQCIGGQFQAEYVPIFVTLKDFAEAANKPGLLEYISQQFSGCLGVGATQESPLQIVMKYGKALILLDGLDEVRAEDNIRVLKEIRDLSNLFLDNHFVMTCRISAIEYTFENFTDVEIADFDDEQISDFAINWFQNKAIKSSTFIKRIEDNERIKELGRNPLLLTLLCLVFEGSGNFPANRSELYEEGLDVLLRKWDASKGIDRDQVYKNLSTKRKEDLLSKIALTTFEQKELIFKQKAAEQYITDYIENFRDANTDPKELQTDSKVVLRSLEAQHGLLIARAKGFYSFSHLTFHEYFTAREIIVVKQSSEEALQNLVSHITDIRWREVFLLAVGMLPSANRLLQLMKQQVNGLVAADDKLQQVLISVNQKSVLSVKAQYKPVAVRAFYLSRIIARTCLRGRNLAWNLTLALSRELDFNLICALDEADACDLARRHARDCNLDLNLDLARKLDFDLNFDLDFDLAHDLARNLSRACKNVLHLDLNLELQRSLQQIKAQLPNPEQDREKFDQWWNDHGQAWTETLRVVMIKYFNIGHDWQLSNQQKNRLKHYYSANKLLVDCLNSDCYVSREVRQEIEDTLLLPIAEIEN